MRSRGIIIAFFLVTFLVLNPHSVAAGFNFGAGLGYDFLSQRYFLEDLQFIDSDSILVDWELRSTYLDDLKGLFTFEFNSSDNKIKIHSSYEQTADFLRLKISPDFRLRPGNGRLDFYADFEWRNGWEDPSEFGNSYLFGSIRSKLKTPLGKSYSSLFQLKTEKVQFQSESESSFDYFRLSGYGGIEKSFDNFSFMDLKFFFSYRKVSDSTILNYKSFGIEGSFFGTLPVGNFDLITRWETKDYNKPDNQNDYLRGELTARNKLNINNLWISRQEVDFEIMNYDGQDLISDDYYRFNLLLQAGLDWLSYNLTAGPEIEILKEDTEADYDSEDYLESGFRIDLDYLNPGKALLSLESTFGIRNLDYETDLQSDFLYERINLINDFYITKSLNLNLLFSGEWEFHDDDQDNNELYILSSSLIYKF